MHIECMRAVVCSKRYLHFNFTAPECSDRQSKGAIARKTPQWSNSQGLNK